MPDTHPSSDVLERVEVLVNAGFATVSRNPSDWEATTAWRHAIRSAVEQCAAHEATIERLSAELERVKGALEPFALCPIKGKHGGRFVIAKAIYDDGDVSPREAHWHMTDFTKARAALYTKAPTAE